MTVKEYLSQPYQIEQKLKYLNRELERYERMMLSVSSPHYDQERVDKSPNNITPNQRALEKYYETKDKIIEKEKEYDRIVEEITAVIDKLENEDCRMILKYHYLDGKQFVEIADKMLVVYKTIQRWHKKALDELNVQLDLI